MSNSITKEQVTTILTNIMEAFPEYCNKPITIDYDEESEGEDTDTYFQYVIKSIIRPYLNYFIDNPDDKTHGGFISSQTYIEGNMVSIRAQVGLVYVLLEYYTMKRISSYGVTFRNLSTNENITLQKMLADDGTGPQPIESDSKPEDITSKLFSIFD